VEWYADYGSIAKPGPIHVQQQQLFVVTDLMYLRYGK